MYVPATASRKIRGDSLIAAMECVEDCGDRCFFDPPRRAGAAIVASPLQQNASGPARVREDILGFAPGREPASTCGQTGRLVMRSTCAASGNSTLDPTRLGNYS